MFGNMKCEFVSGKQQSRRRGSAACGVAFSASGNQFTPAFDLRVARMLDLDQLVLAPPT